jgi:hypothetical protein
MESKRATLFYFKSNVESVLSELRKDGINIGGERYFVKESHSVSPGTWLLKAFELGSQGYAIVFDDYAIFKKIDEDLKKLCEAKVQFTFFNLRAIDMSSFKYFYDASQFEKQIRSKKIKEGLSKKRDHGEKLGNPNIGNKKSKVQRTKKLKAFINHYESIQAHDIILNRIKKDWSLNQIANHLNEEGFRTQKGAKYSAKTVQRLLEKRNELKDRFSLDLKSQFLPKMELVDLEVYRDDSDEKWFNESKAKNKINIEGLWPERTYENSIEFKILSNLKKPFEIVILDNDNNDDTPVFNRVYQPEDKHIKIELGDNALLPGVHYISIATEEKNYEPVINMKIQLWGKMRELICD